MPVTISKIKTIDPTTQTACKRILSSLPAFPELEMAWKGYLDRPSQMTLWVGWFNERIVGFALLEGQQIKGFAVHSATQGRGVGSRMAQLLHEQQPEICWPTNLNLLK